MSAKLQQMIAAAREIENRSDKLREWIYEATQGGDLAAELGGELSIAADKAAKVRRWLAQVGELAGAR